MDQQPYLSVVIPAYKEREKIGSNLLEIEKFLADKNFEYEIIVVVDGSPNDTAEVVRNYASQLKNIRIIDYEMNRGKGYVVRQGLLETRGKYVVFLDADGSTSITHVEKFLPELEKGFELVIGSRKIQGAFVQIHQPRYREFMGRIGNWLIRIVLGLWNYPDTQCGFKMMTGKFAHRIAKIMVIDRFGFDFEIIALARKFGFKIKQMPVRWLNEESSSVTLLGPNGFFQTLLDLFKVKIMLIIRKYK